MWNVALMAASLALLALGVLSWVDGVARRSVVVGFVADMLSCCRR